MAFLGLSADGSRWSNYCS